MTHVALGAVLIAVCSWITIPSAVPFTLQTFAVFAVCALLGGKRGCAPWRSICCWARWVCRSFPALARAWARFLAPRAATSSALPSRRFPWGVEAKFGEGSPARRRHGAGPFALLRLWHGVVHVCLRARTDPIGLGAALSMCVFPFILPDIAKMALALFISRAQAAAEEKITGKRRCPFSAEALCMSRPARQEPYFAGVQASSRPSSWRTSSSPSRRCPRPARAPRRPA